MTPSVGVIGVGVLGSAVVDVFKYYTEVRAYDVARNAGSTMGEAANQDVVFVCVPTPPDDRGACDVSAVRSVVADVHELNDGGRTRVVIKSTIAPGTAAELYEAFGDRLQIYHSPEFLTERIATLDMGCEQRVIVGSGSGLPDPLLARLYAAAQPGTRLQWCSWDEAALVKLLLNTYFANKVLFFNEMAQICGAMGLQYDTVRDLALGDSRVGPHHTRVPGHDGQLGVGGHCFPKDLSALIRHAEAIGVVPTMLRAVMEKNLEVRS